jgi:hypothetical protein
MDDRPPQLTVTKARARARMQGIDEGAIDRDDIVTKNLVHR